MSDIFDRLAKSDFRSRFKLKKKDIEYIKQKGLDTIRRHAQDFISKKLAPAVIANDGKQTPMKGHPVFIAQHATATCCRGCLYKWHKFPKDTDLTESQKQYIVDIIMGWIARQLKANGVNPDDIAAPETVNAEPNPVCSQMSLF